MNSDKYIGGFLEEVVVWVGFYRLSERVSRKVSREELVRNILRVFENFV